MADSYVKMIQLLCNSKLCDKPKTVTYLFIVYYELYIMFTLKQCHWISESNKQNLYVGLLLVAGLWVPLLFPFYSFWLL